MMKKAQIIKLNPKLPDPVYATEGSAAFDIFANIEEDIVLYPGECLSVSTGYKVWLEDKGLAGLLMPRSGLGSKGLVLKNLVGLIDSDYQGELIVMVWNSNTRTNAGHLDEGVVKIPSYKTGKAFAQYCCVPVVQVQFEVVEEFSEKSERGTGGFGSTDIEKLEINNEHF